MALSSIKSQNREDEGEKDSDVSVHVCSVSIPALNYVPMLIAKPYFAAIGVSGRFRRRLKALPLILQD